MGSMRRQESYIFINGGIDAEGRTRGPIELPCFTCCHCGAIVIQNMRRTRPDGYCAKCDHKTCDHFVCATECHPIKQSLDLAQRFPEANQPFLLRGLHGEILHDLKYEEQEKLY